MALRFVAGSMASILGSRHPEKQFCPLDITVSFVMSLSNHTKQSGTTKQPGGHLKLQSNVGSMINWGILRRLRKPGHRT
jgi:hypothetical protein